MAAASQIESAFCAMIFLKPNHASHKFTENRTNVLFLLLAEFIAIENL